MAYTKLHQSLVTSTVWREPSSTRIVWVTMMAMADKNGEVMASIPGLADIARVTVEECETALTAFLSPDKYSRTKTLEGRRIQEIKGGWFLVNHPDYRVMASREDETQKASIRMARHRRNKAQQAVTVTETLHIAEAEAEAEAEAVQTSLDVRTPSEARTDSGVCTVQSNPPIVPPAGGQVGFKLEIQSGKRPPGFDPVQLRLNAIFHRRPTTPWSKPELKAYKAISPIDESDLKIIVNHYGRNISNTPRNPDIRRHDLCTLLNNWNGEVDRARKYKAPSCY
jgi:hypothetical protein